MNTSVHLSDDLRNHGFDVFNPMRVSWYNEYLQKLGLTDSLSTDSSSFLDAAGEEHASGQKFTLPLLPDFGRKGDTLALLIGNSKAMWPCFLRWLSNQLDPKMRDPVDTYAAQAISRAIGIFAGNTKYDIFWANDMSRERLVDMNRAAATSATCYFCEEMYLSVHPTFGSWVAFRAVVVLDMPASHLGAAMPSFLPPLLSDAEKQAAREAFAAALQASKESNEELSVDGMSRELAHKWAAMRDCVSLGREHKYSAEQSEYHYTKDPEILAQAVQAAAQLEL